MPLGGAFNVENSHLALEILVELGHDPASAASAIASVAAIPGRFEVIDASGTPAEGLTIVVDYAHTADGLEELLATCRAVADGDVIAVYGCGGDRDREKRPRMAAVGAERADRCIFTSDNPRSEDPVAIIDDMLVGVASSYRHRVETIVDRRSAIARALQTARAGDIVVVAGRGHEATQDLGSTRIDFDDRVVVREELARLGSTATGTENSP